MDSGAGKVICIGLQIPDEFRCCICLCATSKALLMSCSHRVCTDCAEQAKLKACPVCSKELPDGIREDEEFAERALNTYLTCGCGAEVLLLEAEEHECERTMVSTLSALSNLSALPRRQDNQTHVNRSTFNCPLCGEANLSRQGLLEHCAQHHKTRSRAVCPICASMPWGDASYVSQDFLRHLQTRHRCDYDVLADYGETEEESVRRVMEESMKSVGYKDNTEDDILAQILRESAGQSEEDLLALALAESMKDIVQEAGDFGDDPLAMLGGTGEEAVYKVTLMDDHVVEGDEKTEDSPTEMMASTNTSLEEKEQPKALSKRQKKNQKKKRP